MTDSINKIYELSNIKKINESSSAIKVPDKTIIYTSSNSSIKTINKIATLDKSYIINLNNDKDDKSDEIIKSDESLILNINYDEYKDINKYEIIYNNDNNLYNLYYLSVNCNNIQCVGMYKESDTSFNLILDNYIGILINCDIEGKFKNHKYIVYSQNIKKKKIINLYNDYPFYFGLSGDQLIYYPFYIICYEHQMNIIDFIEIYPLLIKNIVKYQL